MSTLFPLLVGPFRMSGRLAEPPAGVVFLGEGPSGAVVSVAVLNRGAASDAAALERFQAAIAAGLADGSVVAAQMEGAAPWVAVAFEPGGPTAERFLEPVWLAGGAGGRGPRLVPHWAGSREPALPPPVVARAGAAGGWAPSARWVVGLAGLAAVLGVLLGALFACAPSDPASSPPLDDPSSGVSRPGPTGSSLGVPMTGGPSGTAGSGAAGAS